MAADWLGTFNAFIEDTCVVGTVSYGLTRTRALGSFFDGSTPERRTLLGVTFGLLASTEVVFPGARSPYVFHTLIICLAQFAGGVDVSLPAILTVFAAGLVLRSPSEALQTLAILVATAVVVELVHRTLRRAPSTWMVAATGGVTQLLAVAARDAIFPKLGAQRLDPYPIASVAANVFGLFIAMVVWKDAQTRQKSEQNRLEAEHVRTLVVAAELAELRARIRPHFLFNTLTAIAALCDLDPHKAQSAIIRVSQLMRRHIEAEHSALIPLREELDYVSTYTDIQLLRFGSRISLEKDLPKDFEKLTVPAFSLQTIVENAFQHGLEPKSDQGFVRIAVRRYTKRSVCAVIDNGVGMSPAERRLCLPEEVSPRHGLVIIDHELQAFYGAKGKVRIFSAAGKGTIVAFAIPNRRSDGK